MDNQLKNLITESDLKVMHALGHLAPKLKSKCFKFSSEVLKYPELKDKFFSIGRELQVLCDLLKDWGKVE